MTYYSIFAVLFLFVASSAIVGRSLAGILPFRLRGLARMYFSPAIGAAVFLLISSLCGWTCGHFHGWITPGVHCGITLAALLFDRDRRGLLRYLAFLFAFTLLASWPVMAQILGFGAFNPYNDAFTYLAHAQWLQAHSFRDIPDVANHPLWTQVSFYQSSGLRMGASFLLAWIQGVSRANWSYQTYSAVTAFAGVSASLAMAGSIDSMARTGRHLALLPGLCLSLTLNGFAFGMVTGFLPQTYGLMFALAGLTLSGLVIRACAGARIATRRLLPGGLVSGVVLSASILAYTEFAPFLIAASLLSCAWAFWIFAGARNAVLKIAAVTAVTVLALVNLEWLRLFRALKLQTAAIVGGPVPWTIFEFWTHSVGWRPGPGDGPDGLTGCSWLNWTVSALLALILCIGVCRIAGKSKHYFAMVPHIFLGTLLALAFLYFRFKAGSPWGIGVGQTWNQLKLSQWASPAMLLIIGCSICILWRGLPRIRWLLMASMYCVITLGVIANYKKADERTLPLRTATNFNVRPFSAYRNLAATVARSVKPDELIYIDMPGMSKSREMVAYFLNDFRLDSDWRDDCYINGHLPNGFLSSTAASAGWVISTNAWPGSQTDRKLPCRFFKHPDVFVSLQSIEATYEMERDAVSWWYWTKKKLVARFDVVLVKKTRALLKVKTEYRPVMPDTTLECHIECDGVDITRSITMNGSGTFESQSFMAPQGKLTVRFETNNEAVSLGNGDPRMAAFLIKNLEVAPCNEPEKSP